MDARLSGWSAQPIVEMLIPSTLDDSLAPPGRHVASLFCQHVAPKLPDGRSWDEARETVADLMIDTVEVLRAGLQGVGHRAPDPLAPRPRARVRPCRRRHFPRAPEPRPALFGKAGARTRRLPLAHSGPLHVRRLDPSRRRRHRRSRPQRRARNDPRFSRPAMGAARRASLVRGRRRNFEQDARLRPPVYEMERPRRAITQPLASQFSGFPNGQTPQPLQAGAEVRQIAARAVAQPVEPSRGRNPRRRRIRLDSARHRARAERIADGARRASGDERRNGACRGQTRLERSRDHQAPARHRRAVASHSLR